jgi:collagen type III alpha
VRPGSEAGWTLRGGGEGAFEGETGGDEAAFFKGRSDEGDAVGDAARRVELRQRVGRVGSPVAAGFGDVDESGAEGEGGVAGEVGDGEHLVTEGGDEEEIDLGEEAGHFGGDLAAEAIGLDHVDGGEEAGLAEGVRPGVGDLSAELVDLVVEGDVFKGGGGFGEEDDVEGVEGPVGERDFDGDEAEIGEGGEGGAVDVGGGVLFHPPGEVADAEAADGSGSVEVEVRGNGAGVSGVGAGDGVEDEHGVFDGAGHGAEFVEGPAEGHGAGAGDAAEGGAEAGDAAAHAGPDDGAVGFASDGKGNEGGGGGGAGTGAGAGGAFVEVPGIEGLAAEPDVVEGEGAEGELGDEDCASLIEAVDDGGVGGWDAVAEGLGAIGGGNAGGVEEVFGAPGDAVEGTAVVASGHFLIGAAGLLEGVVGGEGDDAVEPGVEAAEAVEVDLREALGGELAALDPAGELMNGGVGNVFVGGGERTGVGGGAEEAVAGGTGGLAGRDGLDVRPGLEGRWEGDFARAGAHFVEGCHGLAPVGGGLGEVVGGHFDTDELFGLGKGGNGDFGTGGGGGAEGGRRAGSGGGGSGLLLGVEGGRESGDEGGGEERGRGVEKETAAGLIHGGEGTGGTGRRE